MQVDGYSLDAQKAKMKAYAGYNDYEIEQENIRVQTMKGRIQKAREGRWNGAFAPYGYRLANGKLNINEEEAAWLSGR